MKEFKDIDEALNYKEPPLVQITQVTGFFKTPNSDRLTSFTVAGGWTVFASNINQTDEYFGDPRYEIGSKILYFCIDSVLPAPLEEALMGSIS